MSGQPLAATTPLPALAGYPLAAPIALPTLGTATLGLGAVAPLAMSQAQLTAKERAQALLNKLGQTVGITAPPVAAPVSTNTIVVK